MVVMDKKIIKFINTVIFVNNKKYSPGWMDGWVGGWVGGWMDGWMDVKAVLRIAYSNQKGKKDLFLAFESRLPNAG